MLFLLVKFRSLEHYVAFFFAFLAAIVALQVAMSVLNKLDTSYDVDVLDEDFAT